MWNIVHQEKYVGKWKYRQTKVVKNPVTDTLVQQERPLNEHIVAEREDLRIIPNDLERRVNERKAQIDKDRAANVGPSFYSKGSVAKHLFVGSMKCAACGGNFVVVSGKSGGYMGCFNAHRETSTRCGNKQMVRMTRVEEALLDELKSYLDDHQIYRALAKKYNEHMGAQFTNVPRKLEEIENQIFELKRKVENFTRFIADGHWSDTIANNLKSAEQSLKTLESERSYLKDKAEDKVFITPAAIKNRMVQLGELLGMAMPDANAKVRRLFPEKITMSPQVEAGKKQYIASGSINLYGLVRDDPQGVGMKLPLIPFQRVIASTGR